MQDKPKDVLIVRRGQRAEYYSYLEIFANTNGLEIVVDRRRGERRRGVEPMPEDRRHQGRRGPVPQTWELADFVASKREA